MRGLRGIGVLVAAGVTLACALMVPGSAAAQQAQSGFLYMGSQPGEYIGAGAEWRYTHANARFQAHYGSPGDPSSISVDIADTSDGHGPWSVQLGAPRGRPLVPGRYLDADLNAPRPPGYPGIDVSGDGRAGPVNGRFVVREAEFTASGEVVRFRASFVQYFGYRLAALYGVVGIGVPPPASFPKPPPTVAASLTLRSEPGDFVGQGQTLRYSNLENALFRVAPSQFGIVVQVWGYDGSAWSVTMTGPGRVPPPPGVYEGALRNPFQPPDRPGLDAGGQGRGCNMLSGRFTVREATYAPHGWVPRLSAGFEQHCEFAAPALRGKVRVADPQGAVRAALRLIPRSPLADGTFKARLQLRDPRPGMRVRRVRCVAVAGGRKLRRAARVVAPRRASCAWRLPGPYRGMTVRGFLRFEAAGQVVTRRFRKRVR